MTPDAVAALAAYVEREAVSSARIVELIPSAHAMRCRAGDGAEWYVATDRYGTAFGWSETVDDAAAQVTAQLDQRAADQRAAADSAT